MHMMTNGFFQIFFIFMLFHKLCQSRVIYQFCNSQFFWVTVHKTGKFYHHIRKNFNISFFCLDPHKRNCRILNGICQFFCNFCSCFCQNLSCCCINHIFSQNLSCNTVSQKQFFIKFISSYFCQIITFRIKEHTIDQTASAFHCQRLTRTDLLIQFQKTFLITGSCIFSKTCQNLRFFTKQIYDFCICSFSQSTNQDSNRNLSRSVHTNIEYIVRICLVLQPCTTIRNNRGRKQLFTNFVMSDSIINTRGTN